MKKHGWVFTLNNYSQEEMPLRWYTGDLSAPIPDYSRWVPNWENPHMIYVGYGKEKASTGTPHLQGMLVFKRSVGLRSLKKLNERAHWQPMRGSFQEAKHYCSKENFTEWVQPGSSIKICKEKVEEDHIRAEIVAQENDNIESVVTKVEKFENRLETLEKAVLDIKKLTVMIYQKLDTNCVYPDKFV